MLRVGDLSSRTAGGAAAACCVPAIVPSSVFGAFAPATGSTWASSAAATRARIDLPAFLGSDDAQVVAVCDVNTRAATDTGRPQQFLGRKPGQDKVNAYYAKKTGAGQYKGCDAYNDFREIIGRDDIDAVVIVVPDHWHGMMTVDGGQGRQGHLLREAAVADASTKGRRWSRPCGEHKRVLQTGSQ